MTKKNKNSHIRREIMDEREKYDITKPIELPVGMYHLNDNASINFQLNRLVNMDMGDLDEVRKVGSQIRDIKSWETVLMRVADEEYAKGNLRSAMGFYRTAYQKVILWYMEASIPIMRNFSHSACI